MINYNAYPNILTGELYYPYGKAKNASGPEQVDGTPVLESYFNDTIGWMQAFMIYAGITPSGNSENTDASDILDATKYVAGEQAGGYESDTSDIAYTTEQNVKLKTLFCQTGCSAVTLTKGADTNEANRVRVINNSGAAIPVDDGTSSFDLPDGYTGVFIFSGTALLKISPNVNFNTGIVDPRDEFRGGLNISSTLGSNIYNSVSPYVPNSGNKIKVIGSMYRTDLSYSLLISSVKWLSSTEISFQVMRSDNFATFDYTINSTDSTSWNVNISW